MVVALQKTLDSLVLVTRVPLTIDVFLAWSIMLPCRTDCPLLLYGDAITYSLDLIWSPDHEPVNSLDTDYLEGLQCFPDGVHTHSITKTLQIKAQGKLRSSGVILSDEDQNT